MKFTRTDYLLWGVPTFLLGMVLTLWAQDKPSVKLDEPDRLKGQVLQLRIANANAQIALLDEQYRRIRQTHLDERDRAMKELAVHTETVRKKAGVEGEVNWETGEITVPKKEEKE